VESAKYFQLHDLFERKHPEKKYDIVDNYGDCYLVSIIQGIDSSDNKLRALFVAPYYQEDLNINESLALAVEENFPPNMSYGRYWHGSTIFIRIFLLFGDIVFVRKALGIMTIVLFAAVLLVNIVYKQYAFALVYFLSCMYFNFPFTTKCVEYVMAFWVLNVLMLVLAVGMRRHKDQFDIFGFMIFSGCMICFFDFLTVETLLFSVPYFYYISVRKDLSDGVGQAREIYKTEIKKIILAGGLFILSYAMTYVVKWIICYLFDNGSFTATMKQLRFRVEDGTLAGALGNNMRFMLSPDGRVSDQYWPLYTAGVLILLFIIMVAELAKKNIGLSLMGVLAFIPYVRFAVVRNHSELHYFFTYRAQLVTFMFLLFFMISYIKKYALTENSK